MALDCTISEVTIQDAGDQFDHQKFNCSVTVTVNQDSVPIISNCDFNASCKIISGVLQIETWENNIAEQIKSAILAYNSTEQNKPSFTDCPASIKTKVEG